MQSPKCIHKTILRSQKRVFFLLRTGSKSLCHSKMLPRTRSNLTFVVILNQFDTLYSVNVFATTVVSLASRIGI